MMRGLPSNPTNPQDYSWREDEGEDHKMNAKKVTHGEEGYETESTAYASSDGEFSDEERLIDDIYVALWN